MLVLTNDGTKKKTYHETVEKDLSKGSIKLHDNMSGTSCKSEVVIREWLL